MSTSNLIKIAALAGLIAVGGAASAKSHGGGAAFDKVDANGDGKITQAELDTAAATRFATADADNDGFLSTQELLAARVGGRANRMLARFDTDKNGQLSAEELEAAASDKIGKRIERRIRDADANNDGKLSLAEMSARRDGGTMIERLDTDGDGALSAEEFAKAREGRKTKRNN